MIVIGELINSTRDEIKEKIEAEDKEFIQHVAKQQADSGADYIDVNAGAFVNKEVDYLLWLVETVQEVVDKPLALDSPDPEALKKAIEIHEGIPMINSISAEEERYQKIIPLLQEYKAKVVALCMDDEGMPSEADDRLEVAEKLFTRLQDDGIDPDNIFLDPLVKPISVNGEFGRQVLDTIEGVTEWESDVHITCGLSNISYGLPNRKLLNQAFLIMCMERGLDSAIIDPLDDYMMSLIKAAEVLTNEDQFGAKYLEAARAGKLVE